MRAELPIPTMAVLEPSCQVFHAHATRRIRPTGRCGWRWWCVKETETEGKIWYSNLAWSVSLFKINWCRLGKSLYTLHTFKKWFVLLEGPLGDSAQVKGGMMLKKMGKTTSNYMTHDVLFRGDFQSSFSCLFQSGFWHHELKTSKSYSPVSLPCQVVGETTLHLSGSWISAKLTNRQVGKSSSKRRLPLLPRPWGLAAVCPFEEV